MWDTTVAVAGDRRRIATCNLPGMKPRIAAVPVVVLGLAAGVPLGSRAAPAATPGERLQDAIEHGAGASEEDLARTLSALTDGQLPATALRKLAGDLRQALAAHPVTDPTLVNWLRGDLTLVLRPPNDSARQIAGAINDLGSALKRVPAEPAAIAAVQADLRALVPPRLAVDRPDVPAHRYRYPLREAPRYDRSVPVEDFESGSDLWKTWYQPKWSTGIVAVFDPVAKAGGKFGLTISNTGPTSKASSLAKIPRPFQDLKGMNALRMWVRPYGMDPARGWGSTGFIDGSNEIWQADIPDMLTGTEPYVLEVRLADFKRVLRRNNGVIDLENRDVCFWNHGDWKITVDDIMFVHDPALPDFDPARP